MKISGKNNQFDNQHFDKYNNRKSDVNYEEKDIANSPNPAEYLGRSQIVFRGGKLKNESDGEVKFEQIKLKETPILSKEEAVEHLKKFYFTDEDIKELNLEDKETLSQISNYKAYINSGLIAPDFDFSEFEGYMNTMSPESKKEWLETSFSGAFKYANKENLEIFKNYFDYKDENEFYDIMENLRKIDDFDKVIEKLPYINYIEGKIKPKRLKDFRYISDEYYDNLNPKNVQLVKRINETFPDDMKISSTACIDLGKDSDLTPELIEHYCDLFENLSQNKIIDIHSLKYNYSGDDIKTATAKMDKVEQALKDYSINLNSTDTGLAFQNLYDLADRLEEEDVQNYINSLSDDAKLKGILRLPDKNSNFPKDKMAEICNIVYDKNTGDINEEELFKFIEEEYTSNPDTIDGLIKMIRVQKESGGLNTYHPERALHVENKDYEWAAKATKLTHELKEKNIPFNEYLFSNILWDENTDFKELTKFLTYLRDNNINFYEHDYTHRLCKEKDGTKKLELRYLAEKKPMWMNETMWKSVEETAELTQNDEEMQFVKENMFLQDINGRTLFIGEDLKKLLILYQKNPEGIKDALNIKNSNGTITFQTIDSIEKISDSLSLDKERTSQMIGLKNCSHNARRFSAEDINTIVKASQINKELVNELLSEEAIYDNHGNLTYRLNQKTLDTLNKNEIPPYEKSEENINYRYTADSIMALVEASTIDKDFTNYLREKYSNQHFDASDIKFLVEKSQTDKELVTKLVEYTTKDYNGNERPRFDLYNIKQILENAPKNNEFLYSILSKTVKDKWKKEPEYKYNTHDIITICKAANQDEATTKKLLNMSYIRYGHKTLRFEPNELEDLIKDYKTDKKLFNYLLSRTERKYNDELHPLYDKREINIIMEASKKNKPLVQSLLNENKRGNIYIPDDIAGIVTAYEKDPEYTTHLLTLKGKNSNNERYPLVRGYEMIKVINAHNKEPEYTEKLLGMIQKDSYGGEALIYSATEIEQIVNAYAEDKELTDKLINQKFYTKSGKENRRHSGETIAQIVHLAQNDKDFANKIINSRSYNDKGIEDYTYSSSDVVNLLRDSIGCDKEYIQYLMNISDRTDDGKEIKRFKPHEIVRIAKSSKLEDFKKLELVTNENLKNYSINDIFTGIDFIDYIGKNGVNEVPLKLKKTLLRKFVSSNADLFNTSNALKKDFPLLPQSQEEYCETLPAIVRSLGIETNILSDEQISEFNKSINNLSINLEKISDDEYNKLTITQEYDKDDFIIDVLDKVKDLSNIERQKVYDYFGFELYENEENKKTGFSIIGYPVNLNNGKKLAEITDDKTKQVVESLRKDVIKFSENNKISCSNKSLETELNNIANVLPEIRTMIGKTQHGAHHFDVMKHSLKVMQKIAQDDNFKSLDDSDKKVMLLASLMHDITKAEGYSDSTHPEESSYDTFFITKKFKLKREEEIKLYSLIKNHEWLSYVNTAESETERTKRQQSVAFDLQQNNLFDLALIFTHADLKAVKKDNLFHDKKEGSSRIDFNGEIRSFGESADFHSEKIKEYVHELQKSQPILPVTKMPKASTIEKAITCVNDDGSTDIKGVYKDKDGLIVVKFNEVESWEKLGLPKGSTTKGIMATCTDADKPYDVETGNIKFFVHGLDYPNQLAKFDAFSMVDSNALLSVSYAERPETKYRFFRAQGVMLDVPTEYIHGGGNTDSGSGCGKDIQQFKDGYIFGGYREQDRLYISELVKEATGMSDDEYTKFVQENKDKSMTEIEPEDLRNKIIKKFATINSNSRKGNRAYNEMYISNPKSVMGVFAYNMNQSENVDKPLQFLEENDNRTDFLKKYAKEHDIPFYIFGD